MNSNRTLKRTLFGLVLLAATVLPLHAQAPATTFEELRTSLKLKEGESIEITETSGQKYKARLGAISAGSMVVTRKGDRRELVESQVLQIRQKRPEKWWNGMLIGIGSGLAVAAVGIGIACDSPDPECQAIVGLAFIPTFAGAGAGIGAAIDRAISKHDTVFTRSGLSLRRMQVAPILGKNTAAVRVSFGF